MLGRVDRYELLELVGQGSFGGVYRARHVHTGQLVALKLARGAVDADAAARILAEGRAAASLRHPNVVGVLDGGVTDEGEAFVVMELLEGRTLATLLAQEGPLPPSRAVPIAMQILDGLAAAHAAGVVHRDVKPSNVFVMHDDTVKVIDFGISKLRRGPNEVALTLPGIAMGTPGYMAPEQFGDASSVDGRADVYSAGATLFEMLSKKRPIEADTFEEWMRKLSIAPPTPLSIAAPHVPPELAAIVDRAVVRDRDARWPSARAMRDALAASLGLADAPYVPAVHDPTMRPQHASFVPPTLTVPDVGERPPAQGRAAVWGLAVGAGVLALVIVSVFAIVVVLRGRAASTEVAASSADSAEPNEEEPNEGPEETATEEPPVPEPAEEEAIEATTLADGLTLDPPNPVGDLDVRGFIALAERAKPRIQACNPSRARRYASIDLFVGFEKVTMVIPTSEDPGHEATAKCIARAMTTASASGTRLGQNGIFKRATFRWH